MSTYTEALSIQESIGRESKPTWSSRMVFILAAAGSAVGLGNIWKFPYIVGENGGGAFVIVYILCIAGIGLPILMAEILIGRSAGQSPIHCFRYLAKREGHSSNWQIIGWMGIVCAFLILSFYSVVAGWGLSYLWYSVSGEFGAAARSGDTAKALANLFSHLLANPWALLCGHSLIMVATIAVVAKGIRGGIEKAARIMMPGLFVLLAGLVIYAAITSGQFQRAIVFLFQPHFSSLSWAAVLEALGHAFFTLSVGMTAMMAYGAFLKKDVSVTTASMAVAGIDTLVALMAGLAIFPLVFANGMQPDSGPGLIFVTLPVAFSQVPGGDVIASTFFLFLCMAALTSTISILEPVVEHLEQSRGVSRTLATLIVGSVIWSLGIVSVLAFNYWSTITIFGKNFFELFDFLTSSILLPLGGLLIALYAGHVLSKDWLMRELGVTNNMLFRGWRFLLRYLTPAGVVTVLVYNLL